MAKTKIENLKDLKRDTLSELDDEQLARVSGGYSAPTATQASDHGDSDGNGGSGYIA
jgi:hypothetical protein